MNFRAVPGALWQIVALLMCMNVEAERCQAEWVKGVLYGENGGQGANSVRGIELAVGNNIYRLEYAPRFFKPRFRSRACWEVGAMWSVKVTKLEDLGELIDAICTGQVDEWAHEPVRLVGKYLNELAKDPTTSLVGVSSSRWKNSLEFEQYQAKTKALDLSSYRMGSGLAGCLEVVKIERRTRTEVQTSNCSIKLRGGLIDLHFVVVQNTRQKRWEVDEIRID